MTMQELDVEINMPMTSPDSLVAPINWESLRTQVNEMAGATWICTYLAQPWSELECASDYYDMFKETRASHQFEVLVKVSNFIRTTARLLTASDFTFEQLIPAKRLIELDQTFRDSIARDKRNPEAQIIPFTPYEMYLYKGISEGENPWDSIRSFHQNLTDAMRANPPATFALMETLGLDIILPQFPAIDSSQRESTAALMMTRWQVEKESGIDGVEFFSKFFREVNLSTQEENESAESYWSRILQLMPGLEQYVQYDLSPEQNQRPEYYMQICLALAFFALHRKLRYEEMQEAISALVVRNGKIIGAAYNIPTKHTNHFIHAEQRAIDQAVENTGDITLSGASLFSLLEPCIECAPLIRKYNFSELYFGPRTYTGGDTRGKLFTKEEPTEDCPSGDWLAEQGDPYFPIPNTIVYNLFYTQIAQLIIKGQQWKKFILPE